MFDRFRLFRPLSRGLALLLLVTLTGCELLGEDEELVTTGVYVANQGNFSDGNGSVTVYDPLTGTVSPSAVGGLGTLIQSLAVRGDRLYVMSNTGQHVDIFSTGTLARVAQVAVSNPRYMAVVNRRKAYVTSQLYSRPSLVTVVNLETGTRQDSVEVGGFAEGIAVAGDRAYVATGAFGATTEVVVLDTNTDAVVARVDVGCVSPRYVLADAEEDVFVFCSGSPEEDGQVVVLEGATGRVLDRLDVGGRILTEGPGQDAFYVPETREIYAVRDADTILRIDTATNTLVGEIGPLGGLPIGAVAFDAASGRLYVGRVAGYTESGTVTIHERSGTQVGSFGAGIVPTYITFHRAGG